MFTWHAKALAYDDLNKKLAGDSSYFTMAPWTAIDIEPVAPWISPMVMQFKMPNKDFVGRIDLVCGGSPDVTVDSLNFLLMVEAVVPKRELANLVVTSYEAPLKVGNTCHIKVQFQYQGSAGTATLYSAIGNAGVFGFDEVVYGSKNISLPETPSWQVYEREVGIYISSAIRQGIYDLYAKIDSVISPFYKGVITIGEVVPPVPVPPTPIPTPTPVPPPPTPVNWGLILLAGLALLAIKGKPKGTEQEIEDKEKVKISG